MKFKNDETNFICEDCLEEYPEDYHAGWEDTEICMKCAKQRYINFQNYICPFCKKPMKEDESDPYYDNGTDRYAHGKCFKENEDKIPEEELDEWMRCADY